MWIKTNKGFSSTHKTWKCSKCGIGFIFTGDPIKSNHNFCPYCGEDMRIKDIADECCYTCEHCDVEFYNTGSVNVCDIHVNIGKADACKYKCGAYLKRREP